jgi:hypothetical protein
VGQELRQVTLFSAEYQLRVLEKYFIHFVTNLQRESENFNVICKQKWHLILFSPDVCTTAHFLKVFLSSRT